MNGLNSCLKFFFVKNRVFDKFLICFGIFVLEYRGIEKGSYNIGFKLCELEGMCRWYLRAEFCRIK